MDRLVLSSVCPWPCMLPGMHTGANAKINIGLKLRPKPDITISEQNIWDSGINLKSHPKECKYSYNFAIKIILILMKSNN